MLRDKSVYVYATSPNHVKSPGARLNLEIKRGLDASLMPAIRKELGSVQCQISGVRSQDEESAIENDLSYLCCHMPEASSSAFTAANGAVNGAAAKHIHSTGTCDTQAVAWDALWCRSDTSCNHRYRLRRRRTRKQSIGGSARRIEPPCQR